MSTTVEPDIRNQQTEQAQLIPVVVVGSGLDTDIVEKLWSSNPLIPVPEDVVQTEGSALPAALRYADKGFHAIAIDTDAYVNMHDVDTVAKTRQQSPIKYFVLNRSNSRVIPNQINQQDPIVAFPEYLQQGTSYLICARYLGIPYGLEVTDKRQLPYALTMCIKEPRAAMLEVRTDLK